MPKKKNQQQQEWLWLDPSVIRFQHARIRPTFSGCGRSVMQTLEEIRLHQLDPHKDLPPIQVLVVVEGGENSNKSSEISTKTKKKTKKKKGHENSTKEDENTDRILYVSLNNRRLWVLKQCQKEGLLTQIRVRVRYAKSEAELERYTATNCALEAKFLREKQKVVVGPTEKNREAKVDQQQKPEQIVVEDEESHVAKEVSTTAVHNVAEHPLKSANITANDSEKSSDSESSDSDDEYTNPFAILS